MSSGVEKVKYINTIDKIKVTKLTVSGTPTMIPLMGRRDYIKILNVGSTTIEIGDSSLVSSGGNGFPIMANTAWEDSTDAVIYVVSTGADSTAVIYERSSR